MTDRRGPNGLRRGFDGLRRTSEREVAPSLDPAWTEAALLELRLRGVSGTRIGGVLAEVDAHCADSGQSAAEAFGDPVAYVRGLELPTDDLSPRELATATAPVLVQVAGLLAALWGLGAWLDGEPLDLTVGLLVVVTLLAAAVLALLLAPDRALRLVVERPWVLVGSLTGFVTIQVALMILLDGELTSVPAAPVTLVGIALLAVGQIAAQRLPGRIEDDPVTHPLADPTALPAGADAGGRARRLLEVGARWSLPLAALALGAVTWSMHTLA